MTYLPISTTSKKTRLTTSMYSGYSHFQNASKWQADNQFPWHFKCSKGSYSRPAAYYQRGTYCMQNPSCQSCHQRHWRENVLNGKKGKDLVWDPICSSRDSTTLLSCTVKKTGQTGYGYLMSQTNLLRGTRAEERTLESLQKRTYKSFC